MELKLILSLLVTVFSLGVTLLGLPAQIIKNYREKRSGQPLLTLVIMLGFYGSQIGLFIVTGTFVPLISFGIGLVMWLILLTQWFIYRK